MAIRSFGRLFLILLFCTAIHADDDWTYINREEKVKDYQLNQNGRLSYKGQDLNGFALQKTADRVAISPPAPNGAYSVLFSFGNESQCMLLHFEKHTATPLALDADPLIWNSWSPESEYLLVATHSEQGASVYLVVLRSMEIKKVPLALKKDGEMQEFDTGTVSWSSNNVVEFETTIHCSNCDSARQEQVLRTYKVRFDASTLEISAEEQTL